MNVLHLTIYENCEVLKTKTLNTSNLMSLKTKKNIFLITFFKLLYIYIYNKNKYYFKIFQFFIETAIKRIN